jgi:hypothetical protein
MCLASLASFAGSGDSATTLSNIRFTGFVAIEEGQFVYGKFKPVSTQAQDLDHQWYHEGLLNFNAVMDVQKNLRVFAGFEGRMWNSLTPSAPAADAGILIQEEAFAFYFHHVEGVYSVNDSLSPFYLQLGAGLFPYKYNPEVRNLGEYMFRSQTYPSVLITQFDFPLARLTGFHANTQLWGIWKNDLLLTIETAIRPFYDWSVSYCTSVQISKLLTLGGGVSLNRIFPANEEYTHPSDPLKSNNMHNMYITENGDTGYYTFAGTKLMGRLTFDPKALFSSSLFGDEDLKIYGEAAVLGVKDYPLSVLDSVGYPNIWDRTPMMFGFNMPTFKFLDVLSIEGEYFTSPYANVIKAQSDESPNKLPIPLGNVPGRPPYDATIDYTKDSWKWSVYASKTLLNHFTLIIQFARDHARADYKFDKMRDYEELLRTTKDWYWMSKIRFSF